MINQPGMLHIKGPALLASNHPNSFLDSVILDTLFEQPVWSLARGDVFKKKFYIHLLTALKILPVYRTREGVENLTENYKTFEACIGLFQEEAIITIFSEGLCVNEWHLRPLKKGTARLAIRAWESGIPLQVIPVGINYNSFHRFGKNVFLNFGDPIRSDAINLNESDGNRYQAFNARLEDELKKLVFEIPSDDQVQQKQQLAIRIPLLKKIFLFIPSLLGILLHAPLFFPVKAFVRRRTRGTDHYDSVLVALLMILYPVYLLLWMILCLLFVGYWGLLAIPFLPFTAWSAVQLSRQTGS